MTKIEEVIIGAITEECGKGPTGWNAMLAGQILTALDDAGLAVLPKEANYDMRNVAEPALDHFYNGSKDATVADASGYVYRQMAAAFDPSTWKPAE